MPTTPDQPAGPTRPDLSERIAQVWRRESPSVLAALLRRHGDLGDCEDAAQEALLAAARQWPTDGLPSEPRGWLIRVASRRLIDQSRSDTARQVRERAAHTTDPAELETSPSVEDEIASERSVTAAGDDLLLIFLCCHPVLRRPTQVALTLKAVGGLTTKQIAAGFLLPESTIAQRVSRAKATLRHAGTRFVAPAPAELPARVRSVLDVLYLIFTEGHTASVGDSVLDRSLAAEAIRLTRQLYRLLPDHDEVGGLLALMLLGHARAEARTDSRGELVTLADQDRTRWDQSMISEGIGLCERLLPGGPVGPFQLQAAISAVHAEASSADQTDWPQIEILYELLEKLAPSPMVTLNRAVAVGMSRGPAAGLALVDSLLSDPTMRRHHRTFAVRAHLLVLAGDHQAAAADFAIAAELTASLPEQRYLNRQAERSQYAR